MKRGHAAAPAGRAASLWDPSPAWRATQEQAARSDAAPLEGPVRATMEQRFDVDFGAVRVHADDAAAASARSVGAAAYTVGYDIVFGAGRYQPKSGAGQQLLAHELAHVVQQSRGGSAPPDAEARADRAAAQATSGERVSAHQLGGAPIALQAKPDDSASPSGAEFSFPMKTLAGFALNNAVLTPAHVAEIEKLAWGISMHLGIRNDGRAVISVAGHTDRAGDEKLNDSLGQQRADAARDALIEALKMQGIGQDKYGEIATTSMGETSPAVPTPDGVKNPSNRRVEISINVGSQPAKPPAKPAFDPFAPIGPGPIPDTPIGPQRPEADTKTWREMEENQKKIEDFDRKHPPANKSLSEAVIDKVMEELVDPLIRKLPVSKDLQDKARDAVRKGLEKGSEAACDSAVDATGASGKEAEGLKAACKAALKTKTGKPSETRP